MWQAITSPDERGRSQFGVRVDSDWKVGSRISMSSPAHPSMLGEGAVLEVDPPRRLVHTLVALWSDEVAVEGASRVTWQIDQVGDSGCLLLTHDELREGANSELYGGWPMTLSGLKTWPGDEHRADRARVAPEWHA